MMVAVTMTRAMARRQPPNVAHERDYNYGTVVQYSGSFGKVSRGKYLHDFAHNTLAIKIKNNDSHLQEEEAVALLMPPSALL